MNMFRCQYHFIKGKFSHFTIFPQQESLTEFLFFTKLSSFNKASNFHSSLRFGLYKFLWLIGYRIRNFLKLLQRKHEIYRQSFTYTPGNLYKFLKFVSDWILRDKISLRSHNKR